MKNWALGIEVMIQSDFVHALHIVADLTFVKIAFIYFTWIVKNKQQRIVHVFYKIYVNMEFCCYVNESEAEHYAACLYKWYTNFTGHTVVTGYIKDKRQHDNSK